MKTLCSFLIFSCLAGMIGLAASISGCNPIADSSSNTYQARTERDFVLNRHLWAGAGSVIAVNMEDKFSPEDTIPDTGPVGEDVIPIRYIQNGTHYVRLADNAGFNVELRGPSNLPVYYLTQENRAATVNIDAGDYFFIITSYVNWHSDSVIGRRTVFIQPSETGTNQYGYGPRELNTLFTPESCINCDLSKTLMTNMYLGGTNLSGANLSSSNMRLTNFTGATLTGANLAYSDMSFTNLFYANFSNTSIKNTNLYGSNLQHTSFYAADLSYANMNNANLDYADLQYANLSYANLVGAYLNGTNFCGADKTGANAAGAVISPETQCWP